jgi:hypothetical protein
MGSTRRSLQETIRRGFLQNCGERAEMPAVQRSITIALNDAKERT